MKDRIDEGSAAAHTNQDPCRNFLVIQYGPPLYEKEEEVLALMGKKKGPR